MWLRCEFYDDLIELKDLKDMIRIKKNTSNRASKNLCNNRDAKKGIDQKSHQFFFFPSISLVIPLTIPYAMLTYPYFFIYKVRLFKR